MGPSGQGCVTGLLLRAWLQSEQLSWHGGPSSTSPATRGVMATCAFILQTSAAHVLDQYRPVALCTEESCPGRVCCKPADRPKASGVGLGGQVWLGAGAEQGTGEGRRWASWGQDVTVLTRAELGMVGQDTESSTAPPEWSVWAAR